MSAVRNSEYRISTAKESPHSEVGRERTFGVRGRWLRSSFATIALLAFSTLGAVAQSTNAPSPLDYNSFRMISDRNIFNPNRYARSSPGAASRASSRPASRVEYFTLVGLMAYEKGVFAFFDGTSGSYKKTLETNGDISEFKVVEVTPDQLKLVSGTNEFVMHVGMQVRREDEGDWFLTEASQTTTRSRVVVSRSSRHRNASGELVTGTDGVADLGAEGVPEVIVVEPEPTGETAIGGADAAPTDAASNGITDPVLLRLMQRRQEMNQ